MHLAADSIVGVRTYNCLLFWKVVRPFGHLDAVYAVFIFELPKDQTGAVLSVSGGLTLGSPAPCPPTPGALSRGARPSGARGASLPGSSPGWLASRAAPHLRPLKFLVVPWIRAVRGPEGALPYDREEMAQGCQILFRREFPWLFRRGDGSSERSLSLLCYLSQDGS
jgi:hypothetical protein